MKTAQSFLNKKLLLKSRPSGRCSFADFEMQESAIGSADLREGEVLVAVEAYSIDPTNRIWMSDLPAYMPPVALGEVMRAIGVGRIVASRAEGYQEGDLVSGLLGWQTYAQVPAVGLNKLTLPPTIPSTLALGPLGMTGLTAWFGLKKIGKVQPGETVVVSAAAGAVGSVACQLAKLAGARVVGTAGSDEKCEWLLKEAGIDACINYKKNPDLLAALREACPKGIDVYFENVGGQTLEAVLELVNQGARIPLCGLISQYNETGPVSGPRNFSQILMKRVHLEGFIILDYVNEYAEAIAELAELVAQGKLKYQETVVEGFENLPAAVNMLFDGANQGKLIVKP